MCSYGKYTAKYFFVLYLSYARFFLRTSAADFASTAASAVAKTDSVAEAARDER